MSYCLSSVCLVDNMVFLFLSLDTQNYLHIDFPVHLHLAHINEPPAHY